MGVITLTTDFGLSDPYVGLMKGVMLRICPEARMLDLTHDIAPGDLMAGAMVLESAVGFFPPGTIHLAVVDPGVGSDREPVAVRTAADTYVGPNNGLFTAVLARETARQAVRLDRQEYHRHPVSNTFHGRDIFAPIAAHLASGRSLEQVGSTIHVDDLITIKLPIPEIHGDDLVVPIVRVDRFGNLITQLGRDQYGQWRSDRCEQQVISRVGGEQIRGVSRTFSDVDSGQFVVYFGSGGCIEVAVRDASAAERLGVGVGATVRLSVAEPSMD